MSDVCKWCGSARMTKTSGGNPHQFWCGSFESWRSDTCELRQKINTMTDALHATWEKPRFEKDGALVLQVMEYEDFEKVRKAMQL